MTRKRAKLLRSLQEHADLISVLCVRMHDTICSLEEAEGEASIHKHLHAARHAIELAMDLDHHVYMAQGHFKWEFDALPNSCEQIH